MWDTQYTDYKCTNTPAGRDLVREYVDAFRAEGLRIGFYYSLIDWHHPEFPIDLHHPRRDDPDAYEQSKGRDMRKYAQYMRDQVTELLTNYGRIDIMWYDFSYSGFNGTGDRAWMKGKGKDDWEAEALIALTRRLQPGIIIDNRTEIDQDIWTPEQFQPTEWVRHPETGELVTWEACQTFSGSWGYHRDEQTWKSPEMLIRMLMNTVALGGNLLMNVGPTSRLPRRPRAGRAGGLYDWMKLNAAASTAAPWPSRTCSPAARLPLTQSQDGKRLYVHLFAYPFRICTCAGWPGRSTTPSSCTTAASCLYRGKRDHFGDARPRADDLLVLELPPVKPDCLVPVVASFTK